MDVTLRSGPNYVVRIVERPGLWMDAVTLAELSAQLRVVASRTLDAGSLTYGVFAGDKARMASVIITLVSRRDGTPLAFNALAVMLLEPAPHPASFARFGCPMSPKFPRSSAWCPRCFRGFGPVRARVAAR